MSAAVAFAFTAGLVATVNPCGFALLPSFLAFYLGADDGGAQARPLAGRLGQGFLVGGILSAAFAAVFIAAGLLVAAGLRSFLDVVPWLAVAIGGGLVVLGVAMLAGRRVGLLAASRVRVGGAGTGGYRRVAMFGVTYALASLSCTLAVFLVVVAQALTVSNPVQLVAVFGAYAAGSASVLMALSVSAALAKGALARAMRRLLPLVHRGAGALLVLAGAYLMLYWLPPVVSGGRASSGLANQISQTVSSSAASFLSRNVGMFAVTLALLLVAGAALAVLAARRRAPASSDCCSGGDESAATRDTALDPARGRA